MRNVYSAPAVQISNHLTGREIPRRGTPYNEGGGGFSAREGYRFHASVIKKAGIS